MKNLIVKKLSIAFLFIACAFIIYNCDDAGVIETKTDYCISGRISGWSYGSKTLHAYLRNNSGNSFSIASCPVNSNGDFNLCLPTSVPDSALFTSDSIFYSGCSGGNVSFNPPDVKGTEILSFKITSGETPVGYIIYNNYDTLFEGAFSIMYIWVNKDVSVSGSKYCGSDTLIFIGSAVSGWNLIVKTYISLALPGYTILYNNVQPSSAMWKYKSY